MNTLYDIRSGILVRSTLYTNGLHLKNVLSFNPLSLFSGGKQGVWYDPSDKSTLFQDVAGTVPVTKDGDPVALMRDKSGNGNHATVTVSIARPVYQVGDNRGVVNRFTWSEDFAGGKWSLVSCRTEPSAIQTPTGRNKASKLILHNGINPNAATAEGIYKTHYVPSQAGRYSIDLKAAEVTSVRVREGATSGDFLLINLTTGAITNGNSTQFISPSATSLGDGWWRFSWGANADIISTNKYVIRPNAVGDGISGIYINNYQYELGTTTTPYQRNDSHLGGVGTGKATDLHWLYNDKVDDKLTVTLPDMTATVVKATDEGVSIDYPVSITAGGYAITSTSALGRDYGRLIINKELSASEVTQVTNYFNTKGGV